MIIREFILMVSSPRKYAVFLVSCSKMLIQLWLFCILLNNCQSTSCNRHGRGCQRMDFGWNFVTEIMRSFGLSCTLYCVVVLFICVLWTINFIMQHSKMMRYHCYWQTPLACPWSSDIQAGGHDAPKCKCLCTAVSGQSLCDRIWGFTDDVLYRLTIAIDSEEHRSVENCSPPHAFRGCDFVLGLVAFGHNALCVN